MSSLSTLAGEKNPFNEKMEAFYFLNFSRALSTRANECILKIIHYAHLSSVNPQKDSLLKGKQINKTNDDGYKEFSLMRPKKKMPETEKRNNIFSRRMRTYQGISSLQPHHICPGLSKVQQQLMNLLLRKPPQPKTGQQQRHNRGTEQMQKNPTAAGKKITGVGIDRSDGSIDVSPQSRELIQEEEKEMRKINGSS